MSTEFSIEVLCRLNGKRPTIRDRWIAFHRLYRLTMRNGVYEDCGAADCLRILVNPSWVTLMNTEEKSLSRVSMPIFLRWRFLKPYVESLIYWKNRDKEVAMQCRNRHGMEILPSEVAEVRHKIIRIARERAAQHGIVLPKSEKEILDLLKKD